MTRRGRRPAQDIYCVNSSHGSITTEAVQVTRGQREPAGLRRVRIAARLLDDAVRIPFTRRRVGLDSLLGLLPVGGDAVGALLSLCVVLEGYRLGVGRWVLARMVGNVLLDFVVGLVPLLGDVFDAVWNANKRNVALIECHHADS